MGNKNTDTDQELLPKPLTDLPKEDIDLPLPEKEIPANITTDSKQLSRLPKIIFFIISFIVLLVLMEGGFYLYKNAKKSTPAPSSTPVTVATPTPDPTLNWQTYNNPTLGYIFKYPANWSLLNNESLIRIYPPKVKITNGLGPDDPTTPYISIEQSQTNPINCKGENCPIFGESKPFIVANTYNATLYSQMEHTLGIKCKCNTQKIVLKSEDTYYVITLHGEATPNLTVSPFPIAYDYQEVFESLLSTFKLNGLATESKKTEISEAIENELGIGYTNIIIRSIYDEDYALGSAGFSNTGGGIEFIAHRENGIWKVIWRGNEVPGCSEFTNYPDFPKGLNCDSNY